MFGDGRVRFARKTVQMSSVGYHGTTHTATPPLTHGGQDRIRQLTTGYPEYLEELVTRPQWVTWRAEPRTQADGTVKVTKIPFQPGTNRKASSTDASTWGTWAEAMADVKANRAAGMGFVFSEGDSYFGIDLDSCRDPESGMLEPWAHAIVKRFGTYAEPSPSGTGVHIIGRGVKPARDSRKGKHIECYDRARFFTMTLSPLPGYDRIRDCSDVLNVWHREVWPQVAKNTTTVAPALSLEDHHLIEKLQGEKGGQGIGARLLDGDLCGHPSPSEARAALAWKACFYTDDPEQVARILLASGLFKASDGERERERKARQDAQKQCKEYTGARYSPGHSQPLSQPQRGGTDPELERLSVEELRDIIRRQTALIETERAARIAAEERANRLAKERSHAMWVLRNGDLGAMRLSLFAVAMDLHARIANGEDAAEKGYKTPAARYAEMTGQSEGTVAKHLREAHKRGLIMKHVVKEQTEREVDGEVIDTETGEVRSERETVRGLRDVNYVEVPEGKVINLIERLATYQRPEGETAHGGAREKRPACLHHPDAGTFTVRHEHIECAHCHAILEQYEPTRNYHPAEDPKEVAEEVSGSMMTPEPSSVVNLLSGSKMTPQPEEGAIRLESPRQDTGSIMASQRGPHPCLDCGMSTGNRYRCDRCIELAQLEDAS